jgi:hypothetical protein
MKVEGYIITTTEALNLRTALGAALSLLAGIIDPPSVSENPAVKVPQATLAAARKPAGKAPRKPVTPPASPAHPVRSGQRSVESRLTEWMQFNGRTASWLIAELKKSGHSCANHAQAVYSTLNVMKRMGRAEKTGHGVWALKRQKSSPAAPSSSPKKPNRLGLIASINSRLSEKDPLTAATEKATRIASEEA